MTCCRSGYNLINGLLLGIDGTVYQEGCTISGAAESLGELRRRGDGELAAEFGNSSEEESVMRRAWFLCVLLLATVVLPVAADVALTTPGSSKASSAPQEGEFRKEPVVITTKVAGKDRVIAAWINIPATPGTARINVTS